MLSWASRRGHAAVWAKLLLLPGLLPLCFLMGPVAVVMLRAFSGEQSMIVGNLDLSLDNFLRLATERKWSEPLLRSVGVATCVSVTATCLGLLCVLGLQRVRSDHFRASLLGLYVLPLIVPPVVLAVGLLDVMSRMQLVDTAFGLYLAHVLLAFPYAMLVIGARFSHDLARLQQVGRSFGASSMYSFLRVVVPGLRSALLTSALLTFLVSFDEPVLSLFLTSSRATTLPRRLFDAIRYDYDPVANAASALLIIATAVVFGVRTGVVQTRRRLSERAM